MSWIRLSALDGVDDNGKSVGGAVRAFRGGP